MSLWHLETLCGSVLTSQGSFEDRNPTDLLTELELDLQRTSMQQHWTIFILFIYLRSIFSFISLYLIFGDAWALLFFKIGIHIFDKLDSLPLLDPHILQFTFFPKHNPAVLPEYHHNSEITKKVNISYWKVYLSISTKVSQTTNNISFPFVKIMCATVLVNYVFFQFYLLKCTQFK